MQYVLEVGYASLMHETGLISIIIILSLVLYSIVVSFKVLRDTRAAASYKLIALWALSILVGFITSMLAEDTYMQQPFSLYYPIALFVMVYLPKEIISIKKESYKA